MGGTFLELNDTLRGFIERQHVFFVATAPLAAQGHINLSPKGLDLLRVLDSTTVAYLDLAGSGIETVAHVRENGRVVLMFCAFDGAPKIVRLHGRGRVIEIEDAQWADLSAKFPPFTGARAVVVVTVERAADSCGFGVPMYAYQGQRKQLVEWADKKGAAAVKQYAAKNNRQSIGGLPGLRNV